MVFFIFIQIFIEHSVSKQWRMTPPQFVPLIWDCTVCLGPTKRMLGLYGLSSKETLNTFDPLKQALLNSMPASVVC